MFWPSARKAEVLSTSRLGSACGSLSARPSASLQNRSAAPAKTRDKGKIKSAITEAPFDGALPRPSADVRRSLVVRVPVSAARSVPLIERVCQIPPGACHLSHTVPVATVSPYYGRKVPVVQFATHVLRQLPGLL